MRQECTINTCTVISWQRVERKSRCAFLIPRWPRECPFIFSSTSPWTNLVIYALINGPNPLKVISFISHSSTPSTSTFSPTDWPMTNCWSCRERCPSRSWEILATFQRPSGSLDREIDDATPSPVTIKFKRQRKRIRRSKNNKNTPPTTGQYSC